MEALYNNLYVELQLKTAGIVFGVVLILAHVAALFQREKLTSFLKKFPRDRVSGIVLLAICSVWSFFLIDNMHLGEFYTMERFVKFIIPIGFFLVMSYVSEFLSVRSLGVLAMLLPAPFLNAAFLEAPFTRLLIPILCYVWIIVGMFWVGMPYLLRDWIDWITEEGTDRWKKGCIGGASYGAIVLLCAIIFY